MAGASEYQSKLALGLMSGTSLDGVDAALIRTDGTKVLERLGGICRAYERAERATLMEALAIMRSGSFDGMSEKARRLAEPVILNSHLEAIEQLLGETKTSIDQVDVIGFHGQTLFHDAAKGQTLQADDGAALAGRLNCDVVYDFRSQDVDAGGEGAPLVPVYHKALAEFSGLELPVVVVNIGGVANVTFIGGDDELLAFDTGPGNAMMDDWVRGFNAGDFDEGGRIAAKGVVSEAHVTAFLEHKYFSAPPPRSLDRNDFPIDQICGLSLEDGTATLLEISARTIAGAANWFSNKPLQWIVVGGGGENEMLMQRLAELIDVPLRKATELGWDGQFVEAEAFGYMAVRHLLGLPLTFPGTTGVKAPLTGGLLVNA